MYFVLYLPELDDSIVGGEELEGALLIVHKFDGVHFLVQFDRLQVVKLWLVGLNFRKVPVVEISTVLEFAISEDNDSAALVSDSQVLACLVEGNSSEDV